jgi:hypothetical protein
MFMSTNCFSILKSHPCHSDLPVDARTFLKTPRKVTFITPGEYFHFDLVNGLKGIIDNNLLPANHDTIDTIYNRQVELRQWGGTA